MIVSTDYSYLRLAASPSDAMKEQHPDKRSWWVDPQGNIKDVGHDHNKFLEQNTKIFGKWADIDKALTLNWIRVAFWNGEFVVHCHYITRAQIAACQEIYKSLGREYKVYISTLNKSGYISPGGPHGFIWADSLADLIPYLFKDPTGIRGSRRRVGSEDRAWLVSPGGNIINCGEYHPDFIKENQGLLMSMDAGGMDEDELVKEGWGRIGLLGPQLLYIECKRLNDSFFKVLKDLTKRFEQVSRVMVNRNKVIDRRDFLSMDSPLEVRLHSVNASRKRSASEYEGRAWFVSPQGDIINCEKDHANFLHRNQDLMRSKGAGGKNVEKLVEEGWGQIGLFGTLLYLNCKKLNNSFFKIMQDFTKKLEKAGRVMIGNKLIDRQEFLGMDDPIELRFWPDVESSRRSASLPKSRNFLIGVSLDDMPWPLRQAFDLLKDKNGVSLSEKKDKLSANQVVSVFQAKDKFLQDHVGRTATELIQELNAFFQYGRPKEQIA